MWSVGQIQIACVKLKFISQEALKSREIKRNCFHNDIEIIKYNLIKKVYLHCLIDKVIKNTLIISFLLIAIN